MGLGLTETIRGDHKMCLTTVHLMVYVYPRALLSRWLSVASKGKLMSIESVMPSNHLILCCLLLLLPSIFRSIRAHQLPLGQ